LIDEIAEVYVNISTTTNKKMDNYLVRAEQKRWCPSRRRTHGQLAEKLTMM
jgi:hypothetical protein